MHSSLKFLAVAGFVTLIVGCGSEESSTPVSLDMVVARVQTLKSVDRARLEPVIGTVHAIERAELSTKLQGNIQKMNVGLGDSVKKDSVVCLIYSEETQARYRQAQTAVEQSLRDFEREKKLLDEDASTPERVSQLESQYLIAKAAAEEAKTFVGYTGLKAPFDGVVTRKFANVGDLALPGKPLLEIEDRSAFTIDVEIPESLIVNVSRGAEMTVEIPALNRSDKAVVAELSPSADPVTRTFKAKLQIAHAAELCSGLFSRVFIPSGTEAVLQVPESSVSTWGQMERVFLVKEGKAVVRLVKTGFHENGMVQILSGLNEGEQLILDSGSTLFEGSPIEVKE
jgi:RND family efflux transporter MFP subunit